MTYVAVDIDGTLIRSNISFLFGRFLYEKKKLSFCRALWFVLLYSLQHMHLLPMKVLHNHIFSSLFKNKPFDFFDKMADDFFTEKQIFFREEVLHDIMARYHRGDKVVLLSASPDFLVQKLAKKLSLSECYGTQYLLNSKGFFSMVGRIMTGEEKAKVVKASLDKGPVVAITDSEEDLPLLLMANEVCVVSPSRTLRRRAEGAGWRILS